MYAIFPFSNLVSVTLRYSHIQEFPCKSGAPGNIVDAATVLLAPREEFLTSLSSYRDQGEWSGMHRFGAAPRSLPSVYPLHKTGLGDLLAPGHHWGWAMSPALQPAPSACYQSRREMPME